jgi:hypothetical protein
MSEADVERTSALVLYSDPHIIPKTKIIAVYGIGMLYLRSASRTAEPNMRFKATNSMM